VSVFTDLDVMLLIHPVRVNPIMKVVIFVLLVAKSCGWWHSSFGSILRLACSADLFRAVLVAPWLMTHLTASGGYRINMQINYRSSAGRGLCVGVGVGASWRATRDPGPRASSSHCWQSRCKRRQ
jgi:hypothetical protein